MRPAAFGTNSLPTCPFPPIPRFTATPPKRLHCSHDMALIYAPPIGTIVLCDFRGTIAPEINKKRPAVLLANNSSRLCTVVPLSTTEPSPLRPWHYLVRTEDPLPSPYDSEYHWAKCDIIFVASFERLSLPFNGRDALGKRKYVVKSVSMEELEAIRLCVARAIFPALVLDNQAE